ncbi:hypothetical protein QT397_08420 [Microbulbifer sp. MKSA007]|nr:hypothetical protein QT397_08420 [Microbulbifer sp. MKSA007]
MRIVLIILVIATAISCAIQVPYEGDDNLTRSLLIQTWSRPGEHWTYQEGEKGEFNTYIGHPHFPLTYDFVWSIEDSVLYVEYDQYYEKEQKEYTYNILELQQARMVLEPLYGGRKIVLNVSNF